MFDRARLVTVLIEHQRLDDGTPPYVGACLCGWGQRPEHLGLSWAQHVADVYEPYGDDVEVTIDQARDTAQQTVSACLHGDRDTAADLATGFPMPELLALVLADLVAHVHTRWARGAGAPPIEGWQALLSDIEEWRTA